jgi:XTP/dITP diphosphohydrolase
MPPGASLARLVEIMDRLLAPDGCPWDREQTLDSLRPFLVEETYEVLDALSTGDVAHHCEELGDLLMQIVFQSALRRQEGAFDIDAVVAGISDKLVRRHPHVFGDVVVGGSDEVLVNWDAIKAVEKSRRSVTEGVPLTQAALSLAAKLQKRADRIGVPADLVTAPQAGTAAAVVADLARSGDTDERRIGDLLFAAVALAAAADVDPEAALRGVARAFRDRLAAAEESALVDGIDPGTLDADGWRSRWPAA